MRAWLRRSIARRVAVRAAAVAVVGCSAVGLAVVLVVLREVDPRTAAAVRWIAVIGGALTVAVVTLATGLTVERTLSRPLRRLTEVVRAAEKGKYLADARTARNDEVGDLTRAFDRLCAQITDLSVAVIDTDRELTVTRREGRLATALTALLELTDGVAAEADLDRVLRALPGKVAAHVDADRLIVFVVDPRRGVAVVRGTTGFTDGDALLGAELKTPDGTPAPIVITDLEADARWDHVGGRAKLPGSGILLPLALPGRLLGWLACFRAAPGALGGSDLPLLGSLAASVALALAHAEATVHLRELTVTDDLTGVSNRRLLAERAQIELERARRTGQPLSLLVIDLDHFKQVNDALGHLKGDALLREVARVLLEHVRRADTVARYGGEEFVVLLPDASREQALLAAEKLRATVGESCRGFEAPQTISIGLATFPDDASTFAELLDAADRALFQAKRAGRDRVVVFERPAATSG